MKSTTILTSPEYTVEKEYNVELDTKKRITIRGDVRAKNYHVKQFSNGIILMEPRELKLPDYISEESLQMLYKSLESIKKGIKGAPIDREKIDKILSEE